MAHVIQFTTAKFDVTAERPNPINPIAGESLLDWLATAAAPRLVLSKPRPEDWGWYSETTWEGRSYLVGASAEPADAGAEIDWTVQITQTGAFFQRTNDGCAAYVESLLRAEAAFENFEIGEG